jgi:pyruvate formate lyase activating enzyme
MRVAPELDGSDTLCPACGETLIRCTGYLVQMRGLEGKRCRYCGGEVKVVV